MRLTACSSRSFPRNRTGKASVQRGGGGGEENSKLNPAEVRPGPGRSLPAENDTSPSDSPAAPLLARSIGESSYRP